MATKPDITPELLRQLIRFDEASGKYFWRQRPATLFPNVRMSKIWNSKFVGVETLNSTTRKGYLRVTIFNTRFLAHRVIWAFHHGEWPADQIDHINGDKSDNRIANLRAVSNQENHRNKALQCNNTSGFMGVCWSKRRSRWIATIKVSGRVLNLGQYVNLDDAARARKAAEIKYGFHDTHGRVSNAIDPKKPALVTRHCRVRL